MNLYKICVTVPAKFAEEIISSLDGVFDSPYPGYNRVFSIQDSTGTWRSLEGSDPYDGKTGTITYADETKIEFIAEEKDLPNIVRRIRDVHPYEEPAIDIIPTLSWKDFIDL